MRLNPQPFESMESGQKTIELRLYDEKRKSIRVGDEIEFINVSDERRRLVRTVLALHVFPSFEQLYAKLPLLKCGYTPNDVATASYTDMESYYTLEEQNRCGVVGIELKIKA